jgi:hypothetical protein
VLNVLEIILVVVLGWKFTVGEFVGGPMMIERVLRICFAEQ